MVSFNSDHAVVSIPVSQEQWIRNACSIILVGEEGVRVLSVMGSEIKDCYSCTMGCLDQFPGADCCTCQICYVNVLGRGVLYKCVEQGRSVGLPEGSKSHVQLWKALGWSQVGHFSCFKHKCIPRKYQSSHIVWPPILAIMASFQPEWG